MAEGGETPRFRRFSRQRPVFRSHPQRRRSLSAAPSPLKLRWCSARKSELRAIAGGSAVEEHC
jgi:hypothetical protein